MHPAASPTALSAQGGSTERPGQSRGPSKGPAFVSAPKREGPATRSLLVAEARFFQQRQVLLAPGMSGARHRDPAPQGTAPVSQTGAHRPSHKDNPPLGAKSQGQPSAGMPQTPRQAFARDSSPPPLCPQGPGAKLSSRGVNKGKERERRSFHKSQPPSQGPAHSPKKKRKRTHSGKTQSHPQGQLLHGFHPPEGPGVLPPKVRNKPKTPEGKGPSPHLGRKPAGPPPQLEDRVMAEAAAPAQEDQDLDPPTMSFEAYLTYDQPPARKKKRKSGKTPATALQANSLGKQDSTGAEAEAAKSQKQSPPAAARAPLPGEPPAPAACPTSPDLRPCQPTDPPLAAFPLTPSIQPSPRALPSPRHDQGAGLMGISLSSRTKLLTGSKRARRRKLFALFQDCVQTLQSSVYLLCKAKGVPCSFPQPVLDTGGPEKRPRPEEHGGALASHTDPLGKEHCQPPVGKGTREEAESPREPHEQDVAEQMLHITDNPPKDSPPKTALLETGQAAAVQENVLGAPSPTTGSPRAPSERARAHRVRPIPGKQVRGSHKKKIAPLMAKSIRDYKNWCYRHPYRR